MSNSFGVEARTAFDTALTELEKAADLELKELLAEAHSVRAERAAGIAKAKASYEAKELEARNAVESACAARITDAVKAWQDDRSPQSVAGVLDAMRDAGEQLSHFAHYNTVPGERGHRWYPRQARPGHGFDPWLIAREALGASSWQNQGDCGDQMCNRALDRNDRVSMRMALEALEAYCSQ